MDMDTAILQLNDLRKRVLLGEDVTPEEYKIIADNLRSTRKAGKINQVIKKAASKVRDTEVDRRQWADLLSDLVNTKQ